MGATRESVHPGPLTTSSTLEESNGAPVSITSAIGPCRIFKEIVPTVLSTVPWFSGRGEGLELLDMMRSTD